jgi:RimJ/RimL family protein N-acetyltransferase
MSSPVAVPVLETSRLRLRGHGLDDFPHSAAMWADPAVVRYIRPGGFTEEETWARVLRYVGHWKLLGCGYWVVEDKATGEFLGEAGFADFHRDVEPPLLGRTPEAGWAFRAAAHGKGFASETIAAMVAWGDEHFDGPTACIIQQSNAASVRVAEKNGYGAVQPVKYKGSEVMLYERERGSRQM